MAKSVWLLDVLGMGGWNLDPARGQLVITQRLHALGVNVIPPFDPGNTTAILAGVDRIPTDAIAIYCGDSCGANLFSWVVASRPNRQWRYAALIQASLYCNANCPPIGANAQEVDVFYAPFLTIPLPGLGSYKPQPARLPPGVMKLTYPGRYVCNNGKTTICYLSMQTHVHPGDDNAGVQAVIVGKVQTVMAEAAK